MKAVSHLSLMSDRDVRSNEGKMFELQDRMHNSSAGSWYATAGSVFIPNYSQEGQLGEYYYDVWAQFNP